MSGNDFPAALTQIGHGTTFKDTLCGMLENTQMFRDLSRREIETLADYVGAYRCGGGVTLFREGERGTFMCIVVEGKLEVLKTTDQGDQRQLATVRAGKTLGEMALIDEQPHSASVITTGETLLLALSKTALQRIGEEHPGLAVQLLWRIAQQLSHRLRQTSGQLVDYL